MSSDFITRMTVDGDHVKRGEIRNLNEIMGPRDICDKTREVFPDSVDFLSPEGLDKQELHRSMQFLSVATTHSIKMKYIGGHCRIYYCARADCPVAGKRKYPVKRRMKKKEQGEITEEEHPIPDDKKDVTQECVRCRNDGCGFYFHFEKRANGRWCFASADPKNNVGRGCDFSLEDSICFTEGFVSDLLKNHFKTFYSARKRYTLLNLMTDFEKQFHFRPSRSTIDRAWKLALGMDLDSVLKQNQKIEDYLLRLNQNGQYGVLLYSNRLLLVPSSDGQTFVEKELYLSSKNGKFCPLSRLEGVPFWASLADKRPTMGKRHVRMSFQAIAAAVKAAQHCLPVICLDAAHLTSYHTKGVMLAATVATTEMKMLTICVGTAPVESSAAWDFFMANLREALTRFAPELKLNELVFMSDRHKGIIAGIKKYFSESQHLFCLLHIMRNLGIKQGNRHYLWDAAEAHSERVFNKRFGKLVTCCRSASRLLSIREKWCRFFIPRTVKRFTVRTNNWAEIQNNAMKFLRGGSILTVLHSSFVYTSRKLKKYHEYGVKTFDETNLDCYEGLTAYARKIIEENNDPIYKKTFKVKQNRDSTWKVWRPCSDEDYTVTLSKDRGDCTCLLYHETGIPCPHMILVAEKRCLVGVTKAVLFPLVNDIYSGRRFLLAFPTGDVFIPPDISTYVLNTLVCLPKRAVVRGRPRVLRVASKGEEETDKASVSTPSRRSRNSFMSRQSRRRIKRSRKMCYSAGDDSDYEEIDQFTQMINGDPPSDYFSATQWKIVRMVNDETDKWVFPPCKKSLWDDEIGYISEVSSSEEEDDEQEIKDVADVSDGRRTRKTKPSQDEESDSDSDLLCSSSHSFNGNSPPLNKRLRTGASGSVQYGTTSDPSGATKEMTETEKIEMIWSCKPSDYNVWGGLYECFSPSHFDSSFMQPNTYPSRNNPALIPVLFDELWEIIEAAKPKGMEWKRRQNSEQVPIVSNKLITSFLSLVHLNTVVGLRSQAFAYSHTKDSMISFLGVFPQVNRMDIVTDINRSVCEPGFFTCLSRLDKSETLRGSYVMRCWILTHPTSDVFLSASEILQLFEYSLPDNNCFCIVISPRSKGIKIICFHLTSLGFNKIQMLKKVADDRYSSNVDRKYPFLLCQITDSGKPFYHQVPFAISSENCSCCDLRCAQDSVAQIYGTISRGLHSMW